MIQRREIDERKEEQDKNKARNNVREACNVCIQCLYVMYVCNECKECMYLMNVMHVCKKYM